MNMIAATGKILIRNNPSLARDVQNLLFRLGYGYVTRPHKRRTGSKIYGILYTTTWCNVKVQGRITTRPIRVIRWTSRPDVFKYYPGKLVDRNLEPVREEITVQ